MVRMRKEKSGVIKGFKFTEDCLFASPSAAAVAVKGCSVNGRTAWRFGTVSGESLGAYLKKMDGVDKA